MAAGRRGGHFLRPANTRASRGRGSEFLGGDSTTSHSFMIRPCPGSKRCPSPAATNASTRSFGSFTTNAFLDETIAKILPLTHKADEPNPFFDIPTVTLG